MHALVRATSAYTGSEVWVHKRVKNLKFQLIH